jgi:formyltetrahydrofolate deformylase
MNHHDSFILRATCPDRIGIVADVSTFLARERLFITESHHFGDPATKLFFMRTVFTTEGRPFSRNAFAQRFAAIAAEHAIVWDLTDARLKPHVVVLVSRFDHCLNDLLYRARTGALPVAIPAIISNHTDCAWLAERHAVPFFHVPATPATKAAGERRIVEIVTEAKADLVVLARYMQILSREMCAALAGRAINIHHSFLPSFKGAAPYTQAYARGVKLIGATAHYVTADLDEGPIIAQNVEPVDHTHGPDALIALGRDIEARVLARAVKAHVEKRIFLDGSKTVVFT